MRIAIVLLLGLCTLLSCNSFVTPFPNRGALRPQVSLPKKNLASVTVRATPSSAAHAIRSSFTKSQSLLHSDPSFVLTSILLLSISGISFERRTTVGKSLSAALTTMALALTLANIGVIPFASPIYGMVTNFLVPLAVPMLLFDSDLNRVINDTGSLLLAFFVGAIATIVGTLVAYPLVPLRSLGDDVGWRVACALAARHIGGAINFVAVADTLNIGGTAVSAAIAADNVVVALYFAFLFYISKSGEGKDTAAVQEDNSEKESKIPDPEDVNSEYGDITLPSLAIALSISSLLVTLGRILTKTLLPTGTSSLPVISLLTVFAATTFPNFFSRIRSAGTSVGVLFIQMFFAASGAGGNLVLVLKRAPSLFAFSVLQIGMSKIACLFPFCLLQYSDGPLNLFPLLQVSTSEFS